MSTALEFENTALCLNIGLEDMIGVLPTGTNRAGAPTRRTQILVNFFAPPGPQAGSTPAGSYFTVGKSGLETS